MSEQLFPVFEVTDFIDEIDHEDVNYRRSLKWDIVKGDFVRDGANKLVECDGKEAYMIWCYKMLYTEQQAHLSYDYEFGVEMDGAMTQPTIEAIQSSIETTIEEALLINPLTEYVRDFEFDWDSDNLYCTFTIKGRDMEAFQIQLDLDKEEVNS